MTNQDTLREVREAITAANRALDSLENAERELKGAKNWGLWDIFGGRSFQRIYETQSPG